MNFMQISTSVNDSVCEWTVWMNQTESQTIAKQLKENIQDMTAEILLEKII